VVGHTPNVATGNVVFALARYRPNGRLDPTFGDHGQVTTDVGGNGFARTVALQADGKIVAAGRIVNASPFLGSTLPWCAIGPTVRWIRPSAAMAG
jgi:hypothetical protein